MLPHLESANASENFEEDPRVVLGDSPRESFTAGRRCPDYQWVGQIRIDSIAYASTSLSKDFRFREGMRVTFRREIFNWLNHPDWSGQDTSWRSATFGQVTSKSSNTREMQFSLRFGF